MHRVGLVYPVAVVQDRDLHQAPTRARERVLREAVDDLTAEIRDLRAQREALAEACERLRGGSAIAPATAGRTLAPPPETPGPAATLRRLGKLAIRSSLGALRRIWRLADPAQRFVVATRAGAEPAPSPTTISVIVEAGTSGAAAGVDRLGELAHQSTQQLEVALWDRVQGTVEVRSARGEVTRRSAAAARDELVAALSGSWLATLPVGATGLPTTLLETLQWLVSSEDLGYLRVFPSPVEDDGDRSPGLLLCRRELWQPDGIDLARLAARAATSPVLGKTVGLAGRLDAAVPRLAPLGPGSRALVCRTGRYDVWAGNRAGPVTHLLRPLPAAEPGGPPALPTVLIVIASPLEGGAAGVVAATVRELREEARIVVAATAADHALGVTRALALERLGAAVYDLGSALQPEIWPSALDRIASRWAPLAALTVGHDPRLAGAVASLRARGARIVAVPVGDGAAFGSADVRLDADASAGATAAGAYDPEQRAPVPVGWLLPEAVADASQRQREQTRAELGVPAGGRLVVTAVDLVASARPEDVVVVADRLRREPGMTFAVVSDGPLAGSLRDLAGFLDVDTVRLLRPRHALQELAAAADLVLDPSCEPVVRPLLAAALAAGTPVVTAPGGGAERLLAEIGGGVVVGSIGASDELAAAVREVLADGRRPAAAAARAVLARQRLAGAAAVRRALLGATAAAPE
jgi:hypothetical protein